MSPAETIKIAQTVDMIRDKPAFTAYLQRLLALQAQNECIPLPVQDYQDLTDPKAL